MALNGWRFYGFTATIFLYICSVVLLSLNSTSNNTHPKHAQSERFAELNYHGPRLPEPNRRMTINWCSELRFQRIENRTISTTTAIPGSSLAAEQTALASFPGSGNTWLRYLLQQATGILTGSIYKDYGLLKTGFPAENVCNGSVLLVKTHEWGPRAWAGYAKALLLVRDPEQAIIAEFNRQSGGHIGFAPPERYKRTNGKYWQQFVANKLRGWELMNLSWARNYTGKIKVVYYDDLVAHTERELRNILEFLEFPIDERLLHCAILRKEGIFRRKRRLLSFDPYTSAMRAKLIERRDFVYKQLGHCA